MDCDGGPAIIIARSIGQAIALADGGVVPTYLRGGRYRELYTQPVWNDDTNLGDEGSYYTATNATFGTGLAGPNVAAFSATSALFGFQSGSGAGGVRSYVRYIRLIMTAIPTAGTALELGVTGDPSLARSSGGTALSFSNPNLDASTMPVTKGFYAPTVAAASNQAVNLARVKLKAATPVAGDEFLLVFGAVEKAAGAAALSATVAGQYVVPMPPLILGAGKIQSALVHLWSPSSTAAPSFEFEVGVVER